MLGDCHRQQSHSTSNYSSRAVNDCRISVESVILVNVLAHNIDETDRGDHTLVSRSQPQRLNSDGHLQ